MKNTYSKFAPNVFLAKCSDKYQNGNTITMTTRYGDEHDCIVHNFMLEKDEHYYYSVVRADGFNVQEWAARRAERAQGISDNAQSKSQDYSNKSNKDSDFLSLGEPIKIGHHSEKRHRKIIELAQSNARKSIELSDRASDFENRAEYWKSRADTINLSMPESLDFYEFKLESAIENHRKIKDGEIPKRHSYSLTYAKKDVNELSKKFELAKRLWADQPPATD